MANKAIFGHCRCFPSPTIGYCINGCGTKLLAIMSVSLTISSCLRKLLRSDNRGALFLWAAQSSEHLHCNTRAAPSLSNKCMYIYCTYAMQIINQVDVKAKYCQRFMQSYCARSHDLITFLTTSNYLYVRVPSPVIAECNSCLSNMRRRATIFYGSIKLELYIKANHIFAKTARTV